MRLIYGLSQLGTPFIEGARLVAEVLEQGRDKKLLIFKYKNKTRYRRRHGHRQAYTRLAIKQILTDRQQKADQQAKPVKAWRKRTPTKKEVPTEARAEASAAALPLTSTTSGADEIVAQPRRASRTRRAAESRADAKPAGRGKTKED